MYYKLYIYIVWNMCSWKFPGCLAIGQLVCPHVMFDYLLLLYNQLIMTWAGTYSDNSEDTHSTFWNIITNEQF